MAALSESISMPIEKCAQEPKHQLPDILRMSSGLVHISMAPISSVPSPADDHNASGQPYCRTLHDLHSHQLSSIKRVHHTPGSMRRDQEGNSDDLMDWVYTSSYCYKMLLLLKVKYLNLNKKMVYRKGISNPFILLCSVAVYGIYSDPFIVGVVAFKTHVCSQISSVSVEHVYDSVYGCFSPSPLAVVWSNEA